MKKSLLLLALTAILLAPHTLRATEYTGTISGSSVTWAFNDATNTFYFRGTGSTGDNPGSNYKAYREVAKTVVVANGVTELGRLALYGFNKVETLRIPYLTTLSDRACEEMSSLKNVIFGPNLQSVGADAFMYCGSLESFGYWGLSESNYFTITDGCLYSADMKTLYFYPAGSTRTSYTVPDGVTTLSDGAFTECSNLKTLILPASLTNVGWWNLAMDDSNTQTSITDIYFNCATLPSGSFGLGISIPNKKAITIHASTQELGEQMEASSAWNQFTLDYPIDHYSGKCGDNITYYLSVTDSILVLTGTGAMYSTYNSTTNRAPWYSMGGAGESNLVKEIQIGEGITEVGNFENLDNLTAVSFPSTLTTIRYRAFLLCTNLQEVVLPDNLTTIGSSAFGSCQNLKYLTFGATTPIIGDNAFSYTRLVDIYCPWKYASEIPNLPLANPFSNLYFRGTHLHFFPGLYYEYSRKDVWKDCGFSYADDLYTTEDVENYLVRFDTPIKVTNIDFLDEDGNESGTGSVKEDPIGIGIGVGVIGDGSGSTDCDAEIYYKDQNGNFTTLDHNSVLGEDNECDENYGRYWNIWTTEAHLIPHPLKDNIEFNKWEIDFSMWDEADELPQSLKDEVRSNVIENPVTHELTILLNYATVPGYEAYGPIPLFPFEDMIKAHFTDTKSNKVHVKIDVNWPQGAHLESDHELEGDFFPGETFTVSVVCEEGWHFVTWSDGNTNGENRLVQVGGEDLDLRARVWLNEYYIGAVSADETMGTVTGGGNYSYGWDLTLTAEPKEGYVFDHWNTGSTENPLKIKVTDNATYIAYFKEATTVVTPETYTLAVLSANETMGTVTGGGTYEEGTSVQIAATAKEGYRFKQWNDGNTDNPRTITVTADATYTASFEATEEPPVKTTYTVTLIANPTDGGTLLGAGTYEEGATVIIAANANEGYEFVNWNDGITTAARQLTVNDNIILVANFRLIGEGVEEVSGDQVQGTKILRNGQLIILVGDKEYNAQGVRVE